MNGLALNFISDVPMKAGPVCEEVANAVSNS